MDNCINSSSKGGKYTRMSNAWYDKLEIMQFKAMFYRRWIGVKRSIFSALINILVTLAVSCLAIIVKIMMDSLSQDDITLYNFNAFPLKPKALAIVASDYPNNFTNKPFQRKYIDVIDDLFLYDTGYHPDLHIFEDYEGANEYFVECKNESVFVAMGIGLPEEFDFNGGNNLTMLWNDSVETTSNSIYFPNMSYIAYTNIYRIEIAMLSQRQNLSEFPFSQISDNLSSYILKEYKSIGLEKHADFSMIWSLLNKIARDYMFAIFAPLLISAGLTSVIVTIIAVPITDIQGPIRNYMISCNLKIFPYWFVLFVFDFLFWMIEITLVWLVFVICRVKFFKDNLGPTYYLLFICGFSLLLFIYVISFLFNSPDSASRNAFIGNIILLIIPLIVTLSSIDFNDPVRSFAKTEKWGWLYCLFPPLLLEGYLQQMFTTYAYINTGLEAYFDKQSPARPYSIFAFVDIIIYSLILFLIEKWRKYVQRKSARSNFGDYHEFFETEKRKHPVTEETHQIEEEVEVNHNYAVRIHNVSRMFFNTEGNPISAVNCVSLGIKEGSIFGFLGANGAGKTTLINMIASMLPPSDGTIKINGKDITVENDSSLLSVCPQFNTHLCMDMTICEHIHLYSLLHKLTKVQEENERRNLLYLLDIEDIKDIPIKNLSEGDIRKLSIALTFLGDAKIILLDEPTATLDPVSRKQVHDMIQFYKGKKTFMLCTHLLSEAETLCDTISIMIRGNVYTIGSPQYLQSKFGTDYKVDIQLNDESERTSNLVDSFFEREIPSAVLSIKRPSARIYNIPASSIKLGYLFKKMEEGKKGDNGFNYFTCSSSSLEKVFMEIVKISETEQDNTGI
ncbi:ABC transporter family protein [Trichomonas vaginalis G3]|uniref:ABC transporter family protein n=1 Tax=Trichomonas vaginalis (strain ATCC PRA-98 / G3) TaxID=412133 RepID=A2F1K5_TRIV3|nr:ATP-binding cassette transporter subfamily A ABCA family [Trichomonas vaginalis G3]EAY01223.1 ABC transporter family protein [Trichomonas vaginalis G3]KAI5532497.1 ATP-binding cassette transporter subfamily A ABCA family [Trichomonas vaginalis G3]|eukprot:XP_001330139.1 ABC transporter family protein [Trichomonas vaginalis G3]